SRIEQNTKTPPTIAVNVPPPQVTVVQQGGDPSAKPAPEIVELDQIQSAPDGSEIGEGKELKFRFWYSNPGPREVKEVRTLEFVGFENAKWSPTLDKAIWKHVEKRTGDWD